MAAFGLRAEGSELGPRDFYLLPENVEAFELWLGLQTQWRTGAMCATGLDYTAVEAVFRMECVPRKRQRDLLRLVRGMEAAALKVYAERAERQRPASGGSG